MVTEREAPGVDVAALVAALVDRKTGAIARLEVLPRTGDQLRLAHLLARVPDLDRVPSAGAIADPCGGRQTLAAAVRQVVLECVERSCAAVTNRRTLVYARPSGDGAFLDGTRLPLYAAAQYAAPGFPFRPLTPASRIWWAEGRSLVTGRPVFVPAALVFIPYPCASEDEWLGPGTSTGMACDGTWTRAAVNGLLEVIERDAFAITWLGRLSRRRLAVPPASPLGRELARIASAHRGQVTFVDITTDVPIPTVLAVLDARVRGERVVTVGAACRPDAVEAARKALSEAVCDHLRIRDELDRGEPRFRPAPDFANVTDWRWHSLVYLDPALQPALDFLTASPDSIPIDAVPSAPADDGALLAAAVRELARLGEDVIVVDLTTRDAAALGLHAVKVFVPGAVPLPPDHRYQPLAHRRLYEVPRRLGLATAETRVEDLNPYPHPFA
jgi:ribosomal protein S12 methylthiotransferase accessory factor